MVLFTKVILKGRSIIGSAFSFVNVMFMTVTFGMLSFLSLIGL
jgi:hypothetical protein